MKEARQQQKINVIMLLFTAAHFKKKVAVLDYVKPSTRGNNS